MTAEERWKSIADRERKKADLFERKFINYRNKMLRIYENLDDNEPLKKEIRVFLEDEQGDITFLKP